MSMLPLPVVRAHELPPDVRDVLRPGDILRDAGGVERRLPSTFMRIDSWNDALVTHLTRNFTVSEFIGVDVREAMPLRLFPRYVPCALVLLAGALEMFRREVSTYVHVAANGGYRSPGHASSRHASRHSWGTAANIYRIGDTLLDSREEIEKYAAIARRVMPGVWVRPFGTGDGEADDHLHLDLGYTVFEPVDEAPAGANEEAA